MEDSIPKRTYFPDFLRKTTPENVLMFKTWLRFERNGTWYVMVCQQMSKLSEGNKAAWELEEKLTTTQFLFDCYKTMLLTSVEAMIYAKDGSGNRLMTEDICQLSEYQRVTQSKSNPYR